MAGSIRVASQADLAEADRILCAAFRRPASFLPHLNLHHRIEPGMFFVAEENGRLAGTVGAIVYDAIAYVGLMGVDPTRQRQGIARRLLAHLLERLDERGCETVLLDATDYGAPLYEQFGFVDDGLARLLVLEGPPPPPAASTTSISNEVELGELVALDAAAFGASREKLLRVLLEEYGDRLLAARDRRGQLRGYLLARDPTLGPWVALDTEAAEALLADGLQLSYLETPQVLVPRSNEQSRAMLHRLGFVEQRTLRHMRRGGQAPPGRRAFLFGQSSFTHG